MVVKSFKIEHISLKFVFGLLPLFFLVLELAIFFLFLEHITLVVTSRRRSVLLPVPKTYPAKLVSAALNLTGHVIATLVFLNSSLTFGTWLRVSHYPCKILRFCSVLYLPKLYNVTVSGLVTL